MEMECGEVHMGADDPRYLSPDTVKSATDIFATEKDAAYLAGGTDLMPLFKSGLCRPSCLIDLEKIHGLNRIEERGDDLFIGAMADLARLAEEKTINRLFHPVAQAARSVGSPQIRNMATVGGNLLQERRCIYFNQSEFWRGNVDPCHRFGGNHCYQIPKARKCRALYYSDLAPVLMAYGARAVVCDGASRKEEAIENLIHRHCEGKLGGCLVEGILIPHKFDGSYGIFMKYGVRHAIDFAFSNVGIRFTPKTKEGGGASLAIVVGAVAPTPIRLEETEKEVLMSLAEPTADRAHLFPFALRELRTRSAILREFTVSLKGKRNALLIIVDALRALLNLIDR
jgi:4-hydroxybenzoyl-CoA reductase subunit beta